MCENVLTAALNPVHRLPRSTHHEMGTNYFPGLAVRENKKVPFSELHIFTAKHAEFDRSRIREAIVRNVQALGWAGKIECRVAEAEASRAGRDGRAGPPTRCMSQRSFDP